MIKSHYKWIYEQSKEVLLAKRLLPGKDRKSKGKKAKNRDDFSLILHAAYVSSMKAVAEADWEFERQKARLVKLLGDDKGIEGIITYNRTIKSQDPAFNASKFKQENPELYASYLKEGKESVAVKIHSYRAYSPLEIDSVSWDVIKNGDVILFSVCDSASGNTTPIIRKYTAIMPMVARIIRFMMKIVRKII